MHSRQDLRGNEACPVEGSSLMDVCLSGTFVDIALPPFYIGLSIKNTPSTY